MVKVFGMITIRSYLPTQTKYKNILKIRYNKVTKYKKAKQNIT